MNEIRKTEEPIDNALQYMKKNDIGGPFWIKAVGTIGVVALLTSGLGVVGFAIPAVLKWVIAAIIATKTTDTAYSVYYSRKNSFIILRPKTIITDGKAGLETIPYSLLPESFHKVFDDEDADYMGMNDREFLEYNNEAIMDYYKSNKDNLYRHLLDSLILFPLRKKMKEKKLMVNPTIIDLYYGMKTDYGDRDDFGSNTLKSYWSVIDGIATLVSPDYKAKLKELTGIDIKMPTLEDKKNEKETYLPAPKLHKAISKLPGEMLSFFIPGFSTYDEFSEEGAASEYFELGIKDLVKEAYLSRMVLKYFGKYTDENELEFRRFVDIVGEAKENLQDNKVLVRVVEYASIIEKKAEDVEKILRDYKNNPSDFLAEDSELLQLKLDSLIMQSKKNNKEN